MFPYNTSRRPFKGRTRGPLGILQLVGFKLRVVKVRLYVHVSRTVLLENGEQRAQLDHNGRSMYKS